MKKIIILLFIALSLAAAPRLKAEVSLDFFYDSLAEDGDWFEADDYGYCWQPRGVSDDWSPYTDGYWTHTDAGWTWVSYESHGWATSHYGRWSRLQGRGWVWVPGYEWGPAWVSWRSNDDYVGWAPLPARAVVRVGFSIGHEVDEDYDIGPSYYNFTSSRRFGSPSLRQVIVDRSENITIINQTTNITNITYRDNLVYNGGPDYDRLNSRSDRKIERLQLDRITDIDRSRDNRFSRRENGRLSVIAPAVVPVEAAVRPRNIKASLGKVETDRGWANVRDPQVAERTREKIRQENKGRARQSVKPEGTVAQALRSEARQKPVASVPRQEPMSRNGKRDEARAESPVTPMKNDASNVRNPRGDNRPDTAKRDDKEKRSNPANDQAVQPAPGNTRAPETAQRKKGDDQRKPEVESKRPSVSENTTPNRQVKDQRRERSEKEPQVRRERENAVQSQKDDEVKRAARRNEQAVMNQRAERTNQAQAEKAARQRNEAAQSARQNEQAAVRQNEQAAARQQAARREMDARSQDSREKAQHQRMPQQRQAVQERRREEAPVRREAPRQEVRQQAQPRPQTQQSRKRELTPEEEDAQRKRKKDNGR